jgi:large subunit ribosomal protein L2
MVDFFYTDKLDIPAKVETIEYDPYRTAYIALVCYRDWERRYVVAHKDMKVKDMIITSATAKPVVWNRMEVGNIPVGLLIYNVETIVWQGASNVRAAWTSALILSQEWEYTQVKMPSSEIRLVHKKCFATIWVVSNTDHNQVVIGKAWRARWMGKRPTVLGKSMNPVDHPHGGWEWHSPIGMPYPKTPWGKPALGVKTRRRKDTSRWILRTRKGKLMNK